MRFDTGCACCRDDFYDYEEWLMKNVFTVDHPLVQHKLTLMREKACSTKDFRELLNEIGMLLGYEVTRDLPTEAVEIETPITTMHSPKIAGKKLVFAPVLRAGVGCLEGMLELAPSARVAHIGLYRDPDTLQAVKYYFKAPKDLADRVVVLMTRCWRLAIQPALQWICSRRRARRTFALSVCWLLLRASRSCAALTRRSASGLPPSTAI